MLMLRHPRSSSSRGGGARRCSPSPQLSFPLVRSLLRALAAGKGSAARLGRGVLLSRAGGFPSSPCGGWQRRAGDDPCEIAAPVQLVHQRGTRPRRPCPPPRLVLISVQISCSLHWRGRTAKAREKDLLDICPSWLTEDVDGASEDDSPIPCQAEAYHASLVFASFINRLVNFGAARFDEDSSNVTNEGLKQVTSRSWFFIGPAAQGS